MSDLKIIASDDFEIVARRIEMFAKAKAKLDTLELEEAKAYLAILDAGKTEKSQLQRKCEFAEKIIYAIAEEHPEWFLDEKHLKTPFGSLHSRKTTSHKSADEAHSIRLIETAALRCDDEVTKARLLGLIRVKKELNLEAVECLGEKELAKLQIVRIRGTNLTIKLAKPAAQKAAKGKGKSEALETAVAA